MSANIKASTDGTQGIIGVGGVDQMTVSNAGVVTANSFVGNITGNLTGNVTGGGTFSGNASSATAIATGSTTARSLANRFADVVNVKDFGAVGDGVADDTAAIQAAINKIASIGSGTIVFPHGTFLVTSGFLITTPVTFVGDGNGWYTWVGVTATTGTTIKYDGPMLPDPYVFQFLNIGGGSCGIKNIHIDCNGKANRGVILDGLNGGFFENVSITNPQNVCLTLLGTTHTCSWNTFTNLRLECLSGSKATLWLQGYPTTANACHNTFTNTQINFGGSSNGIWLGGCDNNNFYSTYIYCGNTGVTGYGVYCDTTEQTGFPVNNTFYALQASPRGWYQPGTGIFGYGNQIFGYQLDNGQPLPITNGGPLTCITDRGTYRMSPGASIGRSFGANFCGTISIPAGVTSLVVGFPNGTEPNADYAIFLSSVYVNIMPQYTISAQTTTGFTISFATVTPNCACEFLLIRK
jgi:hypothetical protein